MPGSVVVVIDSSGSVTRPSGVDPGVAVVSGEVVAGASVDVVDEVTGGRTSAGSC